MSLPFFNRKTNNFPYRFFFEKISLINFPIVHILIYRCGSLDDAVSRYIRLVKVLKREFKKINVKTLTIQPEFINPKTSDCDKRNCGHDCGGEANDIEDIGKSTIKDFP